MARLWKPAVSTSLRAIPHHCGLGQTYIESKEIGKSIHYALRLKHSNGTINNGFSTTGFKSLLINKLTKKIEKYLWQSSTINYTTQLRNTNKTINDSFPTVEIKCSHINILTERAQFMTFQQQELCVTMEISQEINISSTINIHNEQDHVNMTEII